MLALLISAWCWSKQKQPVIQPHINAKVVESPVKGHIELREVMDFPAGNYLDYLSPTGYLELSSLNTDCSLPYYRACLDGSVRGAVHRFPRQRAKVK